MYLNLSYYRKLTMKFEVKSAVMPLFAINILFFIMQLILGNNFTNSFMLISKDIFARPWIMVTYMFLHAGFYHLFLNMYVLLMFGALLEQRIGTKRFIFIYFLSGIAAAVLSSFFYERSLGASGAIAGILGMLIILMPELQILFFFVIPMPLWIFGIVYVLIETFGIFIPSGIGHIAHLVGTGAGLLYGLYLKKQKRIFDKKFSSKKHLESVDIEEYLRTGRI